MKKGVACVFVLALLFFFSASSWARPDLSPGPISEGPGLTSPLPAPASPTPTPEPSPPSSSSGMLSQISIGLENSADRLDKLFEGLRVSLQAAGISLDSSDSSLESSISSATSSINSIVQMRADLAQASAAIKAQGLKAALWRDFSLVAALSAGGALLDPQKGQGALIGAGAGAVVAVVVEAWPWLRRILRPRAAAEPKPP